MLCGFHQLSPVTQSGNRVRRSASFVNRHPGNRHPVVVFHKEGKQLSLDSVDDWPTLLMHLDLGPVVELDDNDWTWAQQPAVNFNCHAMAIGSQVGLTPQDWLEGVASSATLDENPTELLLDRYYDLLQKLPTIAETDFLDIQENDVFVCYDTKHSHFIHSGFVRSVDGQMYAISKFGEGPILLTSLELIEAFYAGKYDEVRWYRYAESDSLDVQDEQEDSDHLPRQPR